VEGVCPWVLWGIVSFELEVFWAGSTGVSSDLVVFAGELGVSLRNVWRQGLLGCLPGGDLQVVCLLPTSSVYFFGVGLSTVPVASCKLVRCLQLNRLGTAPLRSDLVGTPHPHPPGVEDSDSMGPLTYG